MATARHSTPTNPTATTASAEPVAALHAMLVALPTIREHADLALFDLDRKLPDRAAAARGEQPASDRRRGGCRRRVRAGAGRVSAGQRLHELIEKHLKRAVTLWFHVGQLAAMPALIGRYKSKA